MMFLELIPTPILSAYPLARLLRSHWPEGEATSQGRGREHHRQGRGVAVERSQFAKARLGSG